MRFDRRKARRARSHQRHGDAAASEGKEEKDEEEEGGGGRACGRSSHNAGKVRYKEEGNEAEKEEEEDGRGMGGAAVAHGDVQDGFSIAISHKAENVTEEEGTREGK